MSNSDAGKPNDDVRHSGQFDDLFHPIARTSTLIPLLHSTPENERTAEESSNLLNIVTNKAMIATVSNLFWLSGLPGSGKSFFAEAFARSCSYEGRLIGSFGFTRVQRRVNHLAASLAYQLAHYIPSTRPHIETCIASTPLIMAASLSEQLRKLFIEPLREACVGDPALGLGLHPRVIVVDALDECDGLIVQERVLSAFSQVFQTAPIPIVILFTGRPQKHITSLLDSPDDLYNIRILRFSLDDYSTNIFSESFLQHS